MKILKIPKDSINSKMDTYGDFFRDDFARIPVLFAVWIIEYIFKYNTYYYTYVSVTSYSSIREIYTGDDKYCEGDYSTLIKVFNQIQDKSILVGKIFTNEI